MPKTIKELEARCRQILYAGPPGSKITDPESHRFLLCEVLPRHPGAREKLGCGIDHFERRRTHHSAKGFWIVRTDGTGDNFSFLKLSPKTPSTERENRIQAFRFAIDPQITAFRSRAFAQTDVIICPVTGQPATYQASHADHVFPRTFAALLKKFLLIECLSIYEAALEADKPGDIGGRLVPALARKWTKFHQVAARLRIVHPSAEKLLRGQSKIIELDWPCDHLAHTPTIVGGYTCDECGRYLFRLAGEEYKPYPQNTK